MTEPVLLRETAGAVAVLTLNRPAALNALSAELLAALAAELDAIAADRSLRAVVLRGAGRVFCAGHDLREMQAARAAPDGGRAAFRALFDACTAVMLRIVRLPQPVVAAVRGVAAAAGCQLAATCDLVVAAEDARFAVNGVNIGLFCSTPMVALTRALPRKAAFEMLTTGDFVLAPRAAELGLVNRVVPAERLHDEAMALAGRIAGKLALAVRIGKRLFHEQAELGLEAAYELAGAAMVENMMAPETGEGIAAFLDRRPPNWPG
jgi:enoyl-CoA hydratase/carnithine racemase